MKRTLLLYTALGTALLVLGGCADRSAALNRRPDYYTHADIAPVTGAPQGPHPHLERWHP